MVNNFYQNNTYVKDKFILTRTALDKFAEDNNYNENVNSTCDQINTIIFTCDPENITPLNNFLQRKDFKYLIKDAISHKIYEKIHTPEDMDIFLYFINNSILEQYIKSNKIVLKLNILTIIKKECKRLNINNLDIIDKIIDLYEEIAKYKADKIGKEEIAMILFFSDVFKSDAGDLKIGKFIYEVKQGVFAIKSNGADSGKLAEIAFFKKIKVLSDGKYDFFKEYPNIIGGIFTSTKNINIFNNWVYQNNISEDIIKYAIIEMVKVRSGLLISIEDIDQCQIINNGLLNIRPLANDKVVSHTKIKGENYFEKFISILDWYNLCKAHTPKFFIYNDNKEYTGDFIFLNFENVTFNILWKYIKISSDSSDYYFRLANLWTYTINEVKSGIEQSLVCNMEVQFKK